MFSTGTGKSRRNPGFSTSKRLNIPHTCRTPSKKSCTARNETLNDSKELGVNMAKICKCPLEKSTMLLNEKGKNPEGLDTNPPANCTPIVSKGIHYMRARGAKYKDFDTVARSKRMWVRVSCDTTHEDNNLHARRGGVEIKILIDCHPRARRVYGLRNDPGAYFAQVSAQVRGNTQDPMRKTPRFWKGAFAENTGVDAYVCGITQDPRTNRNRFFEGGS